MEKMNAQIFNTMKDLSELVSPVGHEDSETADGEEYEACPKSLTESVEMKVDVITEGDDELTCHCQESHQYLTQCESVHGVVRQSAVQYQSGGVTPCLFFSL